MMSARLPIVVLSVVLLSVLGVATSCLAGGATSTTPNSGPKIEALIDQLAQAAPQTGSYLDGTDFNGFIAIDLNPSVSRTLYGSHPPIPLAPLRALVQLGPSALPYLIAHLNDARPTKIVIRGFDMGGMWTAAEYDPRYHLPAGFSTEDLNIAPGGVNRSPKLNDPLGPFHYVKENAFTYTQYYTVRVGDLCYGAIGQIVNRALLPVRPQPTSNMVINSPVFEPKLAEETKKDWEGVNADQLKQSLIADATAFDPQRQQGALTRLCYYFPQDGIALALKLLNRPAYHEDIVDRFIDEDLVQSTKFTEQDIKTPDAIKLALSKPSQPVTKHFAKLFRGIEFGGNGERDIVSQQLDYLMAQPGLYQKAAFAGVSLRPETKKLLAQGPTGAGQSYLNRLLLEDVFAGDVTQIKHRPDNTDSRCERTFNQFRKKYGPAYAAGLQYELYYDIKLDKYNSIGNVPSNPDALARKHVFQTLFPNPDREKAPAADAVALRADGDVMYSVLSFPSQKLDESVDRILRSLSSGAPLDINTDECAVNCIYRLWDSKYRDDCESFCAQRDAYLRSDRSDPSYSSYYIQRFHDALAGQVLPLGY